MSFEEGHPKLGGRVKGTPNKRTSQITDILNEMNVDPVRAILELIPGLEPKEQVDVYLDLMTYIYPKLKAVQFSGELAGSMKMESPKEIDYHRLAELVKIARG